MSSNPNIWITLDDSDNGTRLALALTPEDRAAFNALPQGRSDASIVAMDSVGNLWDLRRASCGADCYCAASGTVLAVAVSPFEGLKGLR